MKFIILSCLLLSASAFATDKMIAVCEKAGTGVSIVDYDYDGVRATIFRQPKGMRSFLLGTSRPIRTKSTEVKVEYMGPDFKLDVVRSEKSPKTKGIGTLRFERAQRNIFLEGMSCRLY